MTAYFTVTLRNLLMRSLSPPVQRPEARPHTERRWFHEPSASLTPQMLFRSEGFAEDLLDSYPTH